MSGAPSSAANVRGAYGVAFLLTATVAANPPPVLSHVGGLGGASVSQPPAPSRLLSPNAVILDSPAPFTNPTVNGPVDGRTSGDAHLMYVSFLPRVIY